MLLTIKERVLLVRALPEEGDIFTQRMVSELHSKLGISEEEFKYYEMENKDGIYIWNPQKDIGVEFTFGEKTNEIIKNGLNALSKAKRVSKDHLSLFDKFFPEELVSDTQSEIRVTKIEKETQTNGKQADEVKA